MPRGEEHSGESELHRQAASLEAGRLQIQPLQICEQRLKRIDLALFGDGEPEKSLIWRIGLVENRLRVHGTLLWSTACMVGALFSRALITVIEGMIEAWQKSRIP